MHYTLIAIGFIIIYKATDVINFAQGPLLLGQGLPAAPKRSSCPRRGCSARG